MSEEKVKENKRYRPPVKQSISHRDVTYSKGMQSIMP